MTTTSSTGAFEAPRSDRASAVPYSHTRLTLTRSSPTSPCTLAQPRDPAQARLEERAQGPPPLRVGVAWPRRAAEPRLGPLRHPPARGAPPHRSARMAGRAPARVPECARARTHTRTHAPATARVRAPAFQCGQATHTFKCRKRHTLAVRSLVPAVGTPSAVAARSRTSCSSAGRRAPTRRRASSTASPSTPPPARSRGTELSARFQYSAASCLSGAAARARREPPASHCLRAAALGCAMDERPM